MQLIAHRVNTIEALASLSTSLGCEVDVRSNHSELYISHDPFIAGLPFRQWLDHYKHGTLIVNLKEEGLEDSVLHLMKTYSIDDFFLLDQSIPFQVKYGNAGFTKSAIRISQYEHPSLQLTPFSSFEWIWLDSFGSFDFSVEQLDFVFRSNKKVCLVSPELHSRNLSEIPVIHKLLESYNFIPDSICTKQPELWKKLYPKLL